MNDVDSAELLASLRADHQRLKEEIERQREAGNCDPMELARLKKRKLRLKDEIEAMADRIVPDIIA